MLRVNPAATAVRATAAAAAVNVTAARPRSRIKMDPELYKYRPHMPRARGVDVSNNTMLNKGMAFSLRERQLLGLHGLIPPAFMDQDQQAMRVVSNLDKQPDDLARYVQLSSLQDRNEKLFYRVLVENVEKLLPVVYTPTVGLACQKFGYIFRKPKGMYITIHDFTVDAIYEMLCNWPMRDVRAIVVTDGERILGLGDLGAYGMGIPIGKLSLYVALAGIQPSWCLPVCLDVGTDNQQLLDDPFYIGLRHKRVRGDRYNWFISNFLQAVVKRYGHDTLVQFEDFANKNAFRLLERYRNKYCVFNDDIQGTASVAVAGLLAATRVTGRPVSDNKYLFYGAGEASIGIAKLTCMAMEKEGTPWEEAKSKIYMVDSRGLLVEGRENMTVHKAEFAQPMEQMAELADIVRAVQPTAIIGAATVGGAFSQEILSDMASFNERPIVFALSNPTSKSECTAEQAYQFTDGRAVFASGSPFEPVTIGGRRLVPGQGNNAYVFPGVALGALLCGARHVTDEMFLIASQTCANLVTQEHLDEGRLYPPLQGIRRISFEIAAKVVEHCYEIGAAAFYPEPVDKHRFIRTQIYDCTYDVFEPSLYNWPQQHMWTHNMQQRNGIDAL